MFVEKLYRAEIWLAGAVIVLDLLLTASIYSPLASSLAPQNISASGTPGTVGLYLSVFVQTLRQQLFMDAGNVLNLFAGGVTVMAITLAWTDRQRAWLLALIVVTLLTLLWPTGIVAWQSITPPLLAQPPYPITSSVGMANFTILVVPLIPVALALIFALTRHKPTPTTAPGTTLNVA